MARHVALILLFSASSFAQPLDQSYTFTTLAGSAGYGFADGPATTAQFYNPSGIAMSAAGAFYVADRGNGLVRKIGPDGIVSTVAGTLNARGNVDGLASTAQFISINAVAVDLNGNVYVADTDNKTIRKISTDGTVGTFAGLAGHSGLADGRGVDARFFAPTAVAVDRVGNVYVEEEDHIRSATRKVSPDGWVTTIRTGTETGSARFNNPMDTGIVVDATGAIYASDSGRNVILKIVDGISTTIAGTDSVSGSRDGTNIAALFNHPAGLALDAAGNLYVADKGNDAVRKISAGTISTLAHFSPILGITSGHDVPPSPTGICVDPSGNIYVVSRGTNSIRRFTPTGSMTVFAGIEGSDGYADGLGSAARFHLPWGIAIGPDRAVYVGDEGTGLIRKVTPNGEVSTVGGEASLNGLLSPAPNSPFSAPRGIAVDPNGNIFVADAGLSVISKVSPSGTVTTVAGVAWQQGTDDGIGSAARFSGPHGITVDGTGTLYVADTSNHTIRKIASDGSVTTIAGTPGVSGHVDGTGSGARFFAPTSLALDRNGDLYVTDCGDGYIRKVTPEGVVSTLAGGIGSAIAYPTSLAIDGTGDLLVVDGSTSQLLKITPDGSVTAVAGASYQSGSNDGRGDAVRFNAPNGVAVDRNGNVYVSDTWNNTIRVGNTQPPALTKSIVAAPTMNFGEFQTLQVVADRALAYQWSVNGQAIAGATSASYTAAFRGAYTVTVWNAVGSVTTHAAISVSHRLSNISARAQTGNGENALILGFAIGGPAGTAKQMLVRAIGPTLAKFGIAGYATNPTVSVFDSNSTLVGFDQGWSNTPVAKANAASFSIAPATSAIMKSVGAFELGNGSADSALVATLPPGNHTVLVTPGANDGVSLAEVYELNPGDSALLSNVSVRGHVGVGESVVIGGFAISGSDSCRVLIRGIGPALQSFGIGAPLRNPFLSLYDASGKAIGTNAGWASGPQTGPSIVGVTSIATPSAMNEVGAFPLDARSSDSAMIADLPAGTYTVSISGSDGGTGIALLEIYLLR